jgi:restriction system protein
MSHRNSNSLVEIALTSKWSVSAAFAACFLILGHVILPAISKIKPVLAPFAPGFQPICDYVAGFFALVAFVKWLLAKAKKSPGGKGSAKTQFIAPANRPAEDVRREPALASDASPKPSEWSLELLRAIEWKRFEDLCQKFYEIKGIRSECTPLGPDGGIDIRLYQQDSERATSIVQCKAWGASHVGVKPVRELLGVMVHEKVPKAFFMTTGKYSEEARNFAAQHPITLIDGEMFLLMLKRLPEHMRRALLDFATEGDYNIPTCPACGAKMRFVEGREGKPDFWGCVNFPKCHKKLGARRGANNLATVFYPE